MSANGIGRTKCVQACKQDSFKLLKKMQALQTMVMEHMDNLAKVQLDDEEDCYDDMRYDHGVYYDEAMSALTDCEFKMHDMCKRIKPDVEEEEDDDDDESDKGGEGGGVNV